MAVVLATEDYLTKRYGFTVVRPGQKPGQNQKPEEKERETSDT